MRKNPRLHRIVPVVAVALSLALSGCENRQEESSLTREQYRSAATALFQQQLFQEAIEIYGDYLRSEAIVPEDVPKVLYQIGNISLENLSDPRAALAKYTVLKAMYPEETFDGQLGKKIVACLEKMDRRLDARQALSRLTEIQSDTSSSTAPAAGSTVVAEFEGRKITLGEIEQVAGKLPDAPLKVNQVVRQYVAQLLMADAARRKGIDGKQEVKIRLQQIENQVLAQAGWQEELKLPEPTPNDLRYFYEANKAAYSQASDSQETDSMRDFQSLLPRIKADWLREKEVEAYQHYAESLLKSAQVRFFSQSGQGKAN